MFAVAKKRMNHTRMYVVGKKLNLNKSLLVVLELLIGYMPLEKKHKQILSTTCKFVIGPDYKKNQIFKKVFERTKS